MRGSLLIAVLVLAGVARSEEPAQQIDPEEVILTDDAGEVAGCTAAGAVSSRAGLGALVGGDVAAEVGVARVTAALAKRAAELGATVVLVEKFSSLLTTTAKGTAYRCPDGVLREMRSARAQRRVRAEKNMMMPERAFELGSGFVGMQGGVANRPGQRVPFRAPPTQYFVAVRNATGEPLHVTATLTLENQPLRERLTVFPGKMKPLVWRSNGVVAEKEIPLEISFYGDEQMTKLLKTEKTALFITRDAADQLLAIPYDGPLIFMFGWKEGLAEGVKVAGTSANLETQYDVAWSLSREESKAHRDCKHVILGAEALSLDHSQISAMFPDENIDRLGENGRLETWRVRSCDEVTAYRVLLATVKDGTTVFAVRRAATQ